MMQTKCHCIRLLYIYEKKQLVITCNNNKVIDRVMTICLKYFDTYELQAALATLSIVENVWIKEIPLITIWIVCLLNIGAQRDALIKDIAQASYYQLNSLSAYIAIQCVTFITYARNKNLSGTKYQQVPWRSG